MFSIKVTSGNFSLFSPLASFTHTVVPWPQMCHFWHLEGGLMVSSGVLEADRWISSSSFLDGQDGGILFLAVLAPQLNFSLPGTKINLHQVKIIPSFSLSCNGSVSYQQHGSACANFRYPGFTVVILNTFLAS